jgi:hypothetical protein
MRHFPYILIAACLCLLFVPVMAGTGGNSGITASGNDSPALPQYVLPVGGFSQVYSWAGPNSSLDLTYLFYSRAWGPGNVTYTITATDYYGPVPEGTVNITIEPSSFTARPGSEYVSHIHLVTGPAFGANSSIPYGSGSIVSSTMFHINVSFEDNASRLCDDSISVWTVIPPGLPAVTSDYFQVGNDTSFRLAPGETREILIEFYRGGGIGNISYILSETPLTITIDPPSFIARHGIGNYPATLTVHADPALATGDYPFTLDIHGAQGIRTFSQGFLVNVSTGAGTSGTPSRASGTA